MKILLAIIHHWNPNGGGRHQSLRPDPQPRQFALQDQLLALRRLGNYQGALNIEQRQVTPANQSIRHTFDIRIITDGENTVLGRLEPAYREMVEEIKTTPETARHLGFEAQKYLARQLNSDYDLFGYLEDDLLIHDPYFFHKIFWFANQLGHQHLLLPHRMELWRQPDRVDKFYIDGPIPESDLRFLIPEPPSALAAGLPVGQVIFESPSNPHSGCFFLTQDQLHAWMDHASWQDGDCSYVSPLESAATRGICKVFNLYKPSMQNAGWLEIQHWGCGFRSLIGGEINHPVA
jgi:hypothetical protein